ncbi:MAG: hypothetical protein ACRDD1_19980, partial [Planctomycetia bacterium]
EGYCPVTMISRAEMVVGAPQYCSTYRGQRFHFAGAREQQLFVGEPRRYLPAESGQCVVAFSEEGVWRPGVLRFPAIFGDQLFFFSDDARRRRFLLDPERYVDGAGRAVRDPVAANPRSNPVR